MKSGATTATRPREPWIIRFLNCGKSSKPTPPNRVTSLQFMVQATSSFPERNGRRLNQKRRRTLNHLGERESWFAHPCFAHHRDGRHHCRHHCRKRAGYPPASPAVVRQKRHS